MIKSKLREIAKNATWIFILLGIPAAVITLRGEITQEIPTWIAIMLGALIGGMVATPANRIANLTRQILTIAVERQIGKPEWDEQDSRKAEEYIQWKFEMRRASIWQFIKWNVKGTARSCAFFTAGTIPCGITASVIGILNGEESLERVMLILSLTALAVFVISFATFITLLAMRVSATKVYFQ